MFATSLLRRAIVVFAGALALALTSGAVLGQKKNEPVLPKGTRAVAVRVKNDDAALPGPRVDVVWTAKREKKIIWKLVVEDVLVVATEANKNKKESTVTLALTADQAIQVNLFSDRGQMKLVLRPVRDGKDKRK